MTHTPTPWKFISDADGVEIIDADNWHIASMNDTTINGDALHDANAAFIVRAVNSHTDLLKAVEWAIAALEKSTPHKDTLSKGFYFRALADCRAALELAKAEL